LADEEIIKHLPESFQAFYTICKKAGLKFGETGEEKKDGDD